MLLRDDSEDRGFGPAGVVGSIVGAIIVLSLWRWWTTRRIGDRTRL